jgi:hypothetical protein
MSDSSWRRVVEARSEDRIAGSHNGTQDALHPKKGWFVQGLLHTVLSVLVVGTAAYDTRTLLFIGAASEIPYALGGLATGILLSSYAALFLRGSPLRLLIFSFIGLTGALAADLVSKTWVTGPEFALPFVLDASVNLAVSAAMFMAFPLLATPKKVAVLAPSSFALLFLLALLYYKMADSGFPLMLLTLAALSLVLLFFVTLFRAGS